jgi:hypothetical protein
MIIINIPFTKEIVKVDGANTELLRFAEGFWEIQRPGEETLYGNQGAFLTSNLIRLALNSLYASANEGIDVGEDVYFRLAPANPGDPLADDEAGSVTGEFGKLF